MAAAAPGNETLGWLSSKPKDPLDDVEKKGERHVLLKYMIGSGESKPHEIMETYVEQLRAYGTEKLASLLPERNFNASTQAEYVLNYVACIIDDQSEVQAPAEKGKTNFSGTMEQLNSLLMDLNVRLMLATILDIEQSRRVKALYGILCNASQTGSDKENCPSTGSGTPDRWQPFFSMSFTNEGEKIFMSGLRQILLNSLSNPPEKIYEELSEICESNDLDNVVSSDVHIHAALLMILEAVRHAAFNLEPKVLKLEKYNFLLEKFCKLNRRTFVRASPSYCFLEFVSARIVAIRSVMRLSVMDGEFTDDDLSEFLARENLSYEK